MIARARTGERSTRNLTFLCGDFLEQDFYLRQFDCVISAAALHHMAESVAIPRMLSSYARADDSLSTIFDRMLD